MAIGKLSQLRVYVHCTEKSEIVVQVEAMKSFA